MSETQPFDAKQPHPRCVIWRFRKNPSEFDVDQHYPCDAPCVRDPQRNRIPQHCGRVIVPEILTVGEKNFVGDSQTPTCADALGFISELDRLDTSRNTYL